MIPELIWTFGVMSANNNYLKAFSKNVDIVSLVDLEPETRKH